MHTEFSDLIIILIHITVVYWNYGDATFESQRTVWKIIESARNRIRIRKLRKREKVAYIRFKKYTLHQTTRAAKIRYVRAHPLCRTYKCKNKSWFFVVEYSSYRNNYIFRDFFFSSCQLNDVLWWYRVFFFKRRPRFFHGVSFRQDFIELRCIYFEIWARKILNYSYVSFKGNILQGTL